MSEHATHSDTPSEQTTGVQSVAVALDLLDCLAPSRSWASPSSGAASGSPRARAHRIAGHARRKGLRPAGAGDQGLPAGHSPARARVRSWPAGASCGTTPCLCSSRSGRRRARPRTSPCPRARRCSTSSGWRATTGLRFSSRVSRLRPIHLTSSGKAVAAFNPAVAEAALCQRDSCSAPRGRIRSQVAVPPLPGRDPRPRVRLQHRGGRARSRLGGGARCSTAPAWRAPPSRSPVR